MQNYYGAFRDTFKKEYQNFIAELKETVPEFQEAWESVGINELLVIFVPSEEDATLLRLKYGKYLQNSSLRT